MWIALIYGAVSSFERVGPDEIVFVVHEPTPDEATVLGQWDGT